MKTISISTVDELILFQYPNIKDHIKKSLAHELVDAIMPYIIFQEDTKSYFDPTIKIEASLHIFTEEHRENLIKLLIDLLYETIPEKREEITKVIINMVERI